MMSHAYYRRRRPRPLIVFIINVHDGRAAVGCDVRASTMVVSNRRIALAVARPESGADGGRWLKG
jgi:hypothetical protein